MTDLNPIERAIKIFGSESKLAEATGFSQVAINKAKKAAHTSPKLAMAIAQATEGKIPLSQTIPEIVAAVREEILASEMSANDASEQTEAAA